MQCPRCRCPVADDPACPECGLSMPELDHKFGVVPRHSQEITDSAGFFSARERGKLRRHLHLLHGRFPEIRLSVFSCNVPNRPARPYGFWLFNRCRFHEVGLKLGRCHSLLLLFNRADSTVSLTGGYGLEGVLDERALEEILRAAVPAWSQAAYLEGTLRMLAELTDQLRKAHERVASPVVEAPVADLPITS